MYRQLILLLIVFGVIAAVPGAASALPLIGDVDRSGGASGDRDHIGVYNGEDDPLPTQAGGWTDGNWCFSDRDYVWANTPPEVDGAEQICTFNSDKGNLGTVTYTVEFPIGATVLLAVDDRFSPQQAYVDSIVELFADPGTFTDTGWDVFVGGDGADPGRQLSVYSAVLEPGTYVFNGANAGGNNFYVIGALAPPAPIRKAYNPDPEDGERAIPTGEVDGALYMLMTFSPGTGATTHTAYFSTSYADVESRSSSVLLGSPPYPTVPGLETGYYAGLDDPAVPEHARTPLVRGETYYWVVDESNDTASYPGDVWSFTVATQTTWGPSPADGAEHVIGTPDLTLSWNQGDAAQAGYNLSYEVFFGTDEATVASATTPDATVTDPTHVVGPLAGDTDHFWRVDTVLTKTSPPFDRIIYTGEVWQFKTLLKVLVEDPNLVGWWKLDGGFGDIAFDWSGHENHGEIRGDPQSAVGNDGGALEFDGTNDYVAIRNLMYNTTGLGEVTVAAWIQTTDGGDQVIVSYDRNEYYRLEINGNGGGTGQIGWDVMTDAGQIDMGSSSRVDDGEWHHVAGVFDNGTAIAYVDGSNDGEASNGATYGSGTTRFGYLCVGSESGSFDAGKGPSNYFGGLLDDVRIYDQALSA
ncbi:MAG: LamG domain-containing protein, partial [Planctomycetota bacterium]